MAILITRTPGPAPYDFTALAQHNGLRDINSECHGVSNSDQSSCLRAQVSPGDNKLSCLYYPSPHTHPTSPCHFARHKSPIMGIMSRFKKSGSQETTPRNSVMDTAPRNRENYEKEMGEQEVVRIFRPRIFAMVFIVSLGGMIFGFDTGQISGFLEMPDFLARFGNTTDPATGAPAFTNVRSGTIVGLLSIGTLIGAIVAAPIADKFGRRASIVTWNIVFIIGDRKSVV